MPENLQVDTPSCLHQSTTTVLARPSPTASIATDCRLLEDTTQKENCHKSEFKRLKLKLNRTSIALTRLEQSLLKVLAIWFKKVWEWPATDRIAMPRPHTKEVI